MRDPDSFKRNDYRVVGDAVCFLYQARNGIVDAVVDTEHVDERAGEKIEISYRRCKLEAMSQH